MCVMYSSYEKILEYVKKRIDSSKGGVVVISCSEIVDNLGLSLSTCYGYLKIACEKVGGIYRRGKCMVM